MNEKRNVKLRDALLKAIAIAAFTAVPATAIAPVAQARVLLDDVNDASCDLGNDDTGNGTADNPWRISTVEDLAEITDCNYYGSEDYYVLTNDLDISPDDNYNNDGFEWNGTDDGWVPIGNATYELIENGDDDYWDWIQEDFDGHFDGQGHTITGLEIDNYDASDDYIGLFGQTNYATIINLNIEGADIDGGDTEVDLNDGAGILVGTDYNSTFTNINVSGDIYNVDDYIGGIVGYTEGTRISRSTSAGTIDGIDGDSDYTGGIVGRADDNSNTHTRLVRVSSSVEVNDPNSESMNIDWVGGIVGEANDWIFINEATFSGSVNGEDNVGGIAGRIQGGSVHDATVTEDGLVRIGDSLDGDQIGGLIGEMGSGTLANSTFAGTIDAEQDVNDVNDLGGAVGAAYDANIVAVVVTSTAEINVIGDGSSSENIGGIVGYADDTTIASVVNNTDLNVIDAEDIGGIVGDLYGSVVSNSVNRGAIDVEINVIEDIDSVDVGGIVGIAGDYSEIAKSTNKGDIVVDGDWGTERVGGIVGYADWAAVVDNYNTGDVSGYYNVAGIVGYTDEYEVTISRNYSVGTLTGYESDPDGIATTTDDDSFSDSSNVVLLSDQADNALEAQEQTAAELKAATDLADLGWSIDADGSDWATHPDLNSGFPYLTWEAGTDEIDEPVQLTELDVDGFTYAGGKRFRLNAAEKNSLNAIIDTIKANPFTAVDINVYYGSKERLAGKRAKQVKRWFVYQGVGTPISVHILPEDGSHDRGLVNIVASVD